MKVIKNKGTKSAELYLYEDIGADWFGGLSAKEFSRILKDLGEVDLINLRINSPGGSVFEGVTMYNLLAAHKADIIVHIDGLAASIASVVAMAGDEIRIAKNAMMMIHDPWGMSIGTATDMRKEAETLEMVRDLLVKIYADRTLKAPDDISSWMEAETWMDAETAQERGFADDVTDEMKQAACVDCSRYGYKHAPPVSQEGERPLYKEATARIAQMQSRLRRKGL